MQLKKITEYLFYNMVFFLPWQTMWLGREVFRDGFKWEYGTIGVYGVDILIVVLLGLILINVVKDTRYKRQETNKSPVSTQTDASSALPELQRGESSRGGQILNLKSQGKASIKILDYKNLLFIFSFLILSWSLVSMIWSPDKLLALYFSGKLLLALGLFWAVRRIDFSWKKLLMTLLIAGALQGALAVGQFLLQDTFSSKWLGLSTYQVAQGGVSVLENTSGRWLRAYGSFPHPNILGGYLAIILLVIMGKSFEIQGQKLKHRGLVWIGSVIIFSGLIVSFSRSAWLVFVLGLGMLFWLQKERRGELGKMLLIFAGTALVWMVAFLPLFLARTRGEARLEKKSVDDRMEYVVQAKEIIREHFWLGVGVGNYTQSVYQKNPQKKIWEIQPVHNVFLLVWAELGLIGLILWLSFLGVAFVDSYKKNKIFTLVLYVSCFMLYVLDHWLWTSHFGLLFFFLLLGLILQEGEIEME